MPRYQNWGQHECPVCHRVVHLPTVHARLHDPEAIAARFWSHVVKRGPDECWEWTGRRNRTGYGEFAMGDSAQMAHRVAYELTVGPVPDGLYVCHHCDNPGCENPRHLFAGTSKDNNDDMRAKGRARMSGVVRPYCRRGHEFTPENELRHGNGRRQCRICWDAARARRLGSVA